MPRDASRSSEFVQATQAAGLLLFGVGIDRGLTACEKLIPRSTYFEPSFNVELLRSWPALWVVALVGLGVTVSAFSEEGRRRIGWHTIDSSGGLHWVAFSITLTLFWSHGGYLYNLYYDQAHFWDRSFLLLLLVLCLRSPLLIPFFLLEVVISRGQLRHPIHSFTPIADELPLRILAMMAGAALWNWILTIPMIARRVRRWQLPRETGCALEIRTRALIYALLCLVGAYYSFAGYAKLEIGESIFDWIHQIHLENLFIAAHQNGWLASLSEPSVFRIADRIASLSIVIAALTVVIELGMLFILVHRWITVGLVAAIVSMHLGIVAMTGVFFWKWLLIDVALGLWLWLRRGDRSLDRIYSPTLFALSIVLICALNGLFGINKFTWWNTRWESVSHVEAVAADGRVYRVSLGDFYPYMLLDFIDPKGTDLKTRVYGVTKRQKLAEKIQSARPRELRDYIHQERAQNLDSDRSRDERAVDDFMRRYFRSRNRRIAQGEQSPQRGFGFLPSAPPLHLRFIEPSNLYRDQAPIVEVRIRHSGRFYTGTKLFVMDDDVIHTVAIPQPR